MPNYYTNHYTETMTKRNLILTRITQVILIFTSGVFFGYFWMAWVFGII